ncbi:YycH family regulatory protein [Fervidibacillus halotolerans]|uniref:Two-component system activity regulator YycH n=1 Tax=Fervidibacillus halotolerans TaxID=2980027 RepID=A0A9E8LZ67_9BACI|nr:two-component system activity regulator YycH [Fervidibacillus halotolerans]WAA12274.1 two-component system activity regulator YycH [Fervidibacillus halotolerans]
MKLETVKSIILTILVLSSIYLFWNLVTYQQNYDSIDRREYVKEINIDQKKSMKELIIPNKLIFRKNETEYTGTEKNAQIGQLYRQLEGWDYYNFQKNSEEFFNRYEQPPYEDVIIFQFSDDIPFDLINSLFNIDAKTVPFGNFRYIFIFPEQLNDEEGTVFFLSSDMKSAVKAGVRYNQLQEFLTLYNEIVGESVPYYAYKKDDESYLFVLNREIEVNNSKFIPRFFDTILFKDALFPDPDFVTKTGNRYTDGSSLLDIFPDTKTLSFVNLTVQLNRMISSDDLMKKAVDYVNGHSGWTDQYLFNRYEQKENKIIFQMYLQDYPVFSHSGASEISLIIGNQGVYSYERPYFKFNISFNPTYQRYQLLSGKNVLKRLEENDSVDLNGIEDILIGYQLTFDMKEPLIILEPSWFYRTDEEWKKVGGSSLIMGGVNDGLE